jgi:hypothetical protein
MKLPNSFKVVWWFAVTGAVTAYLFVRYVDLSAGRAVPADIVAFLVWIALLLAPIFQEVEFLGFKFKQEVQKLKEEIRSEIHSVRAELRNAVDIRTTFSPQISMPAPPPDSQLPNLEARVKAAVAEALAVHGVRLETATPKDLQVTDDVAFLFAVRYAIERELRRLARERQLDIPTRRVAGMQLLRALAQAEAIEPSLDQAIREVYAVSSAAIHSDDVSPAQVGFVREVGPQLVGALRIINGAAVQQVRAADGSSRA